MRDNFFHVHLYCECEFGWKAGNRNVSSVRKCGKKLRVENVYVNNNKFYYYRQKKK